MPAMLEQSTEVNDVNEKDRFRVPGTRPLRGAGLTKDLCKTMMRSSAKFKHRFGVFSQVVPKKNSSENGLNLNNLNVSICLNHKSPHSERTWELVKNVKTTPLLV